MLEEFQKFSLGNVFSQLTKIERLATEPRTFLNRKHVGMEPDRARGPCGEHEVKFLKNF